MPRFWQWYDRGARVDFDVTLLGYIFDWRTWLVAVFSGGGAFLWAVIEGRSPVEVWLMALVAVACFAIIIAAISAGKNMIARGRPDLEIVYDHNDPRFVRPITAGHVRYYVGLRILCHRSVDFPNVRALEGPFANEVLAVAHNGNSFGNVEVYKGGTLDWDDLEIFELVGLPDREHLSQADDLLKSPHRFTLEARGRDVRVARAEFEYNPSQMPMIRMLT
jgi:hypothetical protein